MGRGPPEMIEDPLSVPGVREISGSVRGGDRSAVAWLEAAIAADEAMRSSLNALVQRFQARALERASAVDRLPKAGSLSGVPISVKECFAVRGGLTTLGIRRRQSSVDADDAPIVTRLERQGAVLMGKANVPQAMYLHETDNPVWGRTNHPFNPERGPGGSSGGDAALVAAGVVAAAVGTDLAGSIRQPAHACGVCGIVPSTDRLGLCGGFDTMPSLTVVRPRAGFIARAVGDLEAILAAVSPDVGSSPSASRQFRVGWTVDTGPLQPSRAVVRAVEEAAAWLRRSGVEISLVDGSIVEEAAWVHLAILSADGGRDVRRLFDTERPVPAVGRLLRLAGLPRILRPGLAALARLAGRRLEAAALTATGPVVDAEFVEVVARRDALRERMRSFWRDQNGRLLDAVVMPVSSLPALRHGSADRLILAAAPCLLANLFDLPAGTVPVTVVRPGETAGRTSSRDPVLRLAADSDAGSEGLPVGVQVVALDREESTLLTIMRIIESGRDVAR